MSGFGATVSTISRYSSKRTEREIDDAYCRNEPDQTPPSDHGPPPDRSFARRGLRRVGRTRPVQALVRAAPGHSPQGCGRRALVLGGGPCRPFVGALLPLSARGAPAAVGVRVDVGSDARARVLGDHRDDAVPRRHGSGVDAQRAARRRDGPRPRGGLEALHRHPGREDQRAAVRSRDTRRKERRAMTKHMTGTRKEWLTARLELLEAEKELTRRSDELARRRQELPWVRIDTKYRFETDEGSASLADLFRGRSQLLVYTSCSGPTTKQGVRPARRSRTDSTASPSTWPTTTSCFRRCRGRRSRSCRRTSGGWGGRFPGRPRSAATSTPISMSGSPRSNSARGRSNTTTGARRR